MAGHIIIFNAIVNFWYIKFDGILEISKKKVTYEFLRNEFRLTHWASSNPVSFFHACVYISHCCGIWKGTSPLAVLSILIIKCLHSSIQSDYIMSCWICLYYEILSSSIPYSNNNFVLSEIPVFFARERLQIAGFINLWCINNVFNFSRIVWQS